MGEVIRTILPYWWLVFVFGGSIGGALKGIGVANERRIERRQERFRLEQESKVEIARAQAQGRVDRDAARREVERAIAEHDAIDARWFAYEMDPVTLLDHPMMTDLREALTLDFHRAKNAADLLRPVDPVHLVDDPGRLDEYRSAVHAYSSAFGIAEAEAKRRRRGDFAPDEQERLARAQRLLRLASDEGASPQERQNAYHRALSELEGLVDIPRVARAALENRIAGQLEA